MSNKKAKTPDYLDAIRYQLTNLPFTPGERQELWREAAHKAENYCRAQVEINRIRANAGKPKPTVKELWTSACILGYVKGATRSVIATQYKDAEIADLKDKLKRAEELSTKLTLELERLKPAPPRKILTDAEICHENGWIVGDRLIANEGYGDIVIEITAIGQSTVLARCVSRGGARPSQAPESVWTLSINKWRRVPRD